MPEFLSHILWRPISLTSISDRSQIYDLDDIFNWMDAFAAPKSALILIGRMSVRAFQKRKNVARPLSIGLAPPDAVSGLASVILVIVIWSLGKIAGRKCFWVPFQRRRHESAKNPFNCQEVSTRRGFKTSNWSPYFENWFAFFAITSFLHYFAISTEHCPYGMK